MLRRATKRQSKIGCVPVLGGTVRRLCRFATTASVDYVVRYVHLGEAVRSSASFANQKVAMRTKLATDALSYVA